MSQDSHLAHGELLRPEARDGLREGRDADGVLERVALAEHGPQPGNSHSVFLDLSEMDWSLYDCFCSK